MTGTDDLNPATHHTVPDLDTLYLASVAVARALDHDTQHPDAHHLTWRVTADDWQHILRVSASRRWLGSVQVNYQDQDPNKIYRLFGYPVSVTAFRQGRWPELVISIDRRH